MADETEIPVVLKVYAENAPSVNSVLGDTRKRFGELSGQVNKVAQTAGVLAGSFTLGLTGLVAGAVRTAGQFEQLEAKLQSVLGSASLAREEFRRSLEVAEKTPFDVQGIVRATITIAAFGQSIQRVLPLATALAAAFGREVNDSALILGKAFSGSPRGFRSLANEFGLASFTIAKFGANLTATGGVAVSTAADLEKARRAVEKIVLLRFGDATERQVKTLFGALSNLGDIVQRVAASFGQVLVPAATAATRFLTHLGDAFERLSPATKEWLVYGALAGIAAGTFAVGLASIISITTSAVAGVLALTGAIGGYVTGATAAAAVATGTAGATAATGTTASLAAVGIKTMAGATEGLSTGFAALIAKTGVLVPGVTALAAVIAGVGLIGIRAYVQSLEQADRATKEQAEGLAEASTQFRDYQNIIEQVTNSQGKLAVSSNNVADLQRALGEAFANVTPVQLLRSLEEAGVTMDVLSKAQERNALRTKLLKEQIEDLQAAYAVLVFASDKGGVNFISDGDREKLQKVAGIIGFFPQKLEDVGSALQTARATMAKWVAGGLEVDSLKGKLEEFNPILDENAKRMENFGAFLAFATKTDNPQALSDTMNLLNSQIGLAEQAAAKMGIPFDNIFTLQQQLLTAQGDERKNVEGLLKLYEAKEQLQKKLDQGVDSKFRDRIRAEEIALERNKILFGENKKEEIRVYDELLSQVQKGSQEELSLLNKRAAAKQALKRGEVAEVRSEIDAIAKAGSAGLEQLRASGTATATEVSTAIELILTKLREWGVQNKTLMAEQPKLKAEFEATVAGFTKDLDTSNLQKPKELLRDAIDAAREFGSTAVTATERLAAAQSALALLRKTQDGGQITATAQKLQLAREILAVEHAELQLQKQVTQEQNEQAKLTAGLRREGLETELELLRNEQKQVQDTAFIRFAIAEKEKQILAEKVQAIREQAQEEIDAGATVEQATERMELRITELKDREALRRIQLEKDQTKAVEDELKKQEAIRAGFEANRLGGPNSPIQSAAENAARSNLFGRAFSLDSPPRARRSLGAPPPNQQLGRIRARIDEDIRQGESAPTGAVGAALAATATTNITKTENQSLTIQGVDVNDPVVSAGITRAINQHWRDLRHRGLI